MARALALLVGVAVALLLATSAHGTGTVLRAPHTAVPAVRFDARRSDRLVLTTSSYRLAIGKAGGTLLELVDRRTGVRLVRDQKGCAWAAALADGSSVGGCDVGTAEQGRFSYAWDRAAGALTLRYERATGVSAVVTVTTAADHVDLRLTLDNRLQRPLAAVLFPADLAADATAVRSVYTPTFLPGLRLLPGFFASARRNVERYPSRWAFMDFVAADLGASHVALYSVNPPPSPIAPVDIGVVHDVAPGCAGRWFCLTHAFQTWVRPGESWSSPVVRILVGGSVSASTLAYRHDNGIDAYPSLADKLGSRLSVLARAPLIKIDPWKGLPPFAQWGPYLRRLPAPALLHPVAFQPGGHDESYPDFLPPDPRWGTTASFNAALDDARSLGDLVMPYLNISWWDTQAPTMRELPAPLQPRDLALQTTSGAAVTEQFGSKDGYIVSPSAPAVRARIERLFEEWRSVVPAECLFFDQIGARPWRLDFNPSEPTPLAYADDWLSVLEPYRDRCLMTEDGWDRLASVVVGFHGGTLEMEREHAWNTERYGAGNWAPYPLALWLLHDKVLMYQHDLYDGTMVDDPEVLTFDLAFGLQLSYSWNGETGSLESPWLERVGELQRLLGPLYAGRPLTGFRQLAPQVTESSFGDYVVVANWSATTPFDLDGRRIAPLGFLARDGDRVLAAVLGDAWNGVTIAPPG